MIPIFLIRIGWLMLFSTVLSLVNSITTIVVCFATRVEVEEVGIFTGKKLATIRTPLFPIVFGTIPGSTYVMTDITEEPRAPNTTRLLVLLSGWVATIATAIGCLGLRNFATEAIMTLPHVARGVLSPFAYGRESFRGFFLLTQASPFTGYGVIAAKSIGLSILPISGTAAGHILMTIAKNNGNDGPISNFLVATTSLIFMPAVICWGIALVSCLWMYR
jgi:hypothetical protein